MGRPKCCNPQRAGLWHGIGNGSPSVMCMVNIHEHEFKFKLLGPRRHTEKRMAVDCASRQSTALPVLSLGYCCKSWNGSGSQAESCAIHAPRYVPCVFLRLQVSAFPAVVRTTAFDDARDSGWKRHEQFTIRRAQDIFCN
jgi:hypothetical protein